MKSIGRLLGKYRDRSGIYWHFRPFLSCKIIFGHEKAYIACSRPLPRLPYTRSILVVFFCAFDFGKLRFKYLPRDALDKIANAFILWSDCVKSMES